MSYTFAGSQDYTNSAQKIYMIAGGKEGGNQVADMYKMRDVMIENDFKPEHIFAEDHANEGHNENYWAKEFANVYQWLFHQTVNTTTIQKTEYNVFSLDDSLCITGDFTLNDKVSITDINGRKVMDQMINSKNFCFELKNISMSAYVVNIYNDGKVKYSKKLLLGK